jgi:hypothetical protein
VGRIPRQEGVMGWKLYFNGNFGSERFGEKGAYKYINGRNKYMTQKEVEEILNQDENKIVRKKLEEFKLEAGPYFYNSPYSINEVWDMIMRWINTEE